MLHLFSLNLRSSQLSHWFLLGRFTLDQKDRKEISLHYNLLTMKELEVTIQAVGLFVFVCGYAIQEFQEQENREEAWGFLVCIVGGLIMILGLFIASS